MSTFNLNSRIKIVNPNSNVDADYGPYSSIAEAEIAVALVVREKGKTVGIIDIDGNVVEYWWENSVADGALVPKGGDVSFADILGDPYDNTNLATALNNKFDNPTGLATDYLDGLGDPQPFPSQVFTVDIPVSLSNGKTLGKYVNGQTVPAIGKTAQQVFLDIAIEALNPTVNLSSPTTIAFNQSAISNVLNFNYTINSLGATVATAILQWRRNNTGVWTTLSSSTTTPGSYTHSLTDPEAFSGATNSTGTNTKPFNYQYIVTDTVGGTTTVTVNITPASYVAPSVSLLAAAVTSTSPETNSTREKGNINTNLSGSVTRNSVNVAMTNYTLQYSLNNSTWVDINSAVPLSGASQVIPVTNHNDPTLFNATNIYYRVKVIDIYQTYISLFSTGGNTTISFFYLIFYGPASTTPTTSAQVRALPFRSFTTTTNPFTFGTGVVSSIFTVALPTPVPTRDTIKFWTDDDALGANVVNTNNPFSVADAFGTLVTYNVYTAVYATPFTPTQHIFRITTE